MQTGEPSDRRMDEDIPVDSEEETSSKETEKPVSRAADIQRFHSHKVHDPSQQNSMPECSGMQRYYCHTEKQK